MPTVGCRRPGMVAPDAIRREESGRGSEGRDQDYRRHAPKGVGSRLDGEAQSLVPVSLCRGGRHGLEHLQRIDPPDYCLNPGGTPLPKLYILFLLNPPLALEAPAGKLLLGMVAGERPLQDLGCVLLGGHARGGPQAPCRATGLALHNRTHLPYEPCLRNGAELFLPVHKVLAVGVLIGKVPADEHVLLAYPVIHEDAVPIKILLFHQLGEPLNLPARCLLLLGDHADGGPLRRGHTASHLQFEGLCQCTNNVERVLLLQV
mmetsp:Transcript_138594/g.240989  ORF Transcript_138594/g.240989 Transcript_138594/m.240989 type:complete len:261 (+) Transcript_138594:1750-2532(+)